MSEITLASDQSFLLIRDLGLSLEKSDFRTDRLEQSDEVRSISDEMLGLIKSVTSNLVELEAFSIWDSVSKSIDMENEFVVSLDGDFLIRNPSASVEMTRAVDSIESAEEGRFRRIPRLGSPYLQTQTKKTKDRYEKTNKKPVVIFDDGIGSGRTIESIVNLFEDYEIPIDRIVVVANPSGPKEIGGIKIETLIELEGDFVWLNERDLYWGVARSGISIASDKVTSSFATSGIPYSFTTSLIENRIGIKSDYSNDFRAECLRLNEQFWDFVDTKHCCLYPFSRCTRLHSFAQLISLEPDSSISRYLSELRAR